MYLRVHNMLCNTVYDYDAFGNERNPSDSDTNSFRYCGEYWDSETETLYLRARYYDSSVGRFTQMDSVHMVIRDMPNGQKLVDPLSLNLYTYCFNSPVRYYDPSGNTPSEAWGALPFWGYIHFLVQMYIISLYGVEYKMIPEQPVFNGIRYSGRADLYSEKTNQVWEIKSFGTLEADALAQLSNYCDLLNATPGGMLPQEKFQFSDGIFDIVAYSRPNGLIYYSFDFRKEDSKVTVSDASAKHAEKYMKDYATKMEKQMINKVNPDILKPNVLKPKDSSKRHSIPNIPAPPTGDPIIDFIRDILSSFE